MKKNQVIKNLQELIANVLAASDSVTIILKLPRQMICSFYDPREAPYPPKMMEVAWKPDGKKELRYHALTMINSHMVKGNFNGIIPLSSKNRDIMLDYVGKHPECIQGSGLPMLV